MLLTSSIEFDSAILSIKAFNSFCSWASSIRSQSWKNQGPARTPMYTKWNSPQSMLCYWSRASFHLLSEPESLSNQAEVFLRTDFARFEALFRLTRLFRYFVSSSSSPFWQLLEAWFFSLIQISTESSPNWFSNVRSRKRMLALKSVYTRR